MKFAAPRIEQIHTGLPAFAFRLLGFRFRNHSSQAVRRPVEGELVIRAETLVAGLAPEREMFAARLAQVDFPPRMLQWVLSMAGDPSSLRSTWRKVVSQLVQVAVMVWCTLIRSAWCV